MEILRVCFRKHRLVTLFVTLATFAFVALISLLHFNVSIRTMKIERLNTTPDKTTVIHTTKPTTTTTSTTTTTTTTTTTRAPEPLPSEEEVLRMSHAQLEDLYHGYINSPQILCARVIRMGTVKDGGWEICDDEAHRPNPRNCLVYSFGINFDFTFDDAIGNYGCEVHSFDPSMKTKEHRRSVKVMFHPVGIAGQNYTSSPNNWPLFTLGSHRRRLGHTKRPLDILKMDIEGYEWESLEEALESNDLEDVGQLSFETHLNLSRSPNKSNYLRGIKLLRSLYDKGFRIYMTHRNYVWSSFYSHFSNKQLVTCHEVHMINTKRRLRTSSVP